MSDEIIRDGASYWEKSVHGRQALHVLAFRTSPEYGHTISFFNGMHFTLATRREEDAKSAVVVCLVSGPHMKQETLRMDVPEQGIKMLNMIRQATRESAVLTKKVNAVATDIEKVLASAKAAALDDLKQEEAGTSGTDQNEDE